VATAADGRELVEMARGRSPHLVITDVKMPNMDGIEAGTAIDRERPVPIILLSAHHDEETVRRSLAAPFMSYLIKPISEADLRAAIPMCMIRHKELRALSDEAATLRQTIQDRKVIERAKGILMKRLRIDEDEAFRRMRQMASSQNRKMTDLSREINGAEEVFHRLELIG